MSATVRRVVVVAAVVVAVVKAARLTRPARPPKRSCLWCGCTDDRACRGGCGWAQLDPPLCTRCAARAVALDHWPTSSVA